jgi:GAF domain-containing protein
MALRQIESPARLVQLRGYRHAVRVLRRDPDAPGTTPALLRGGLSMNDTPPAAPSGPASGISAYRTLRAVAGEILATTDLEHLLDRCGTLVQDLLRADACSIALIAEPTGQLVPLLTMAGGRSAPSEPLLFDLPAGRMRDAIVAGRTLVVAHGLVIDGDEPLPLAETQSALVAMLIPLPLGPEVRGILWVGRIHGEPFSPEEQDLAETLTSLVALAVRGTAAFQMYEGGR